MMPAPYPVLQELRLPPVARRFGSRPRRDLNELPPSPPGTALVFQYDGQFTVFDEHRHLTGAEDFVLGALGVAVVNLRPCAFTAELILPSARPGENFAVRVTFEAVVTMPEAVVRQGPMDLAEPLSRHLRRDPKLAEICAAGRIEDIADVRVRVDARIASYYSIRPFEVPGIALALTLVEVLTPRELEEHVRRDRTAELDYAHQKRIDELEHINKLRLQEQERERHEMEAGREREFRERTAELEQDFEARNAERDRRLDAARAEWDHRQRLAQQERDQLLREREREQEQIEAQRAQGFIEGGVPMMLAWAAAQRLITPLELANLRRADERQAAEQIRDLLVTRMNNGDGDLISFDVQAIVDNYMEKLGIPQPAARGAEPGRVTGRAARPALAAPDDEPDETPPDEDDFLD